jgi:hypothetical protein
MSFKVGTQTACSEVAKLFYSLQAIDMSKELSKNTVMQVLDWTYDKAVNGVHGFDSAEEMAYNYLGNKGSLVDQVNSLIRWQNTKAATSGFVSGIGGITTATLTIPANVMSVMYVQIRMVAAIAKMGGYDIKDDRVKSLVFVCLVGDAAKDVLKDAGILIGTQMATQAIKNMSAKTLTAINQKIGFKLVTKFGEKGVINLGKAVPIIGGLIGGTIDLTTTNIIGNVARNTFIGNA